MKNKLAITLLVCLLGEGATAQEQETELRWGEFGFYSNWRRYGWKIDSAYPFLGALPDLREFPKLLDWARTPEMSRADREVILSQMKALSRCDFERPRISANDDKEAAYLESVAKWAEWWSRYGSALAETLPDAGRRHETAWSTIAPTPYLECPDYPISIPRTWSTTLHFQSGDYGGFTEEDIELRIDGDSCELRRRYRTGWAGKGEWTHELWRDLARDEADLFFCSLIYSIDNPWFFGRDQISESDKPGEDNTIKGIHGRPEAWTNYYPSVKWSGILDEDGFVILNHDPWRWHSLDHKMGGETSLDEPIGVVFRLVRDLFPDPSWDPDSSRWAKTNPPPDWLWIRDQQASLDSEGASEPD